MRYLFPALVLAPLLFLSGAAEAYCIRNQTSVPIIIKLETPSPLGKFHNMVGPGNRSCCDWFDQRCNPTGTRDGILIFTMRNRAKGESTLWCDNLPGRRVAGVGDGTITLTQNPGERYGLRCDSRDMFQRPVRIGPGAEKKKKRRMPPPIVAPEQGEPVIPPGPITVPP